MTAGTAGECLTLDSWRRKEQWILAQEEAFADAVGRAILTRPQVSWWMIVLPILFVPFLFRMERFKRDLRQFREQFLISRRRALETAASAARGNQLPDLEALVAQAGLSSTLVGSYRAWMTVLVQQYLDLLAADGEGYLGLARAAYGGRANYLLAANQLDTVENTFYAALTRAMAKDDGELAETVAAISRAAIRLRRQLAERLFP
ncbi:MAG: NF038143 family protein [Chloroflexota bacterium]